MRCVAGGQLHSAREGTQSSFGPARRVERPAQTPYSTEENPVLHTGGERRMKCGLAPPKRRVQYHLPSPLLFRRVPYAGQIGPDGATFVVAIASSRTKQGRADGATERSLRSEICEFCAVATAARHVFLRRKPPSSQCRMPSAMKIGKDTSVGSTAQIDEQPVGLIWRS